MILMRVFIKQQEKPTNPNAVTSNTCAKKIELVCTFFHFPLVSVPVHCRLWNVEEGGVQNVDCEESGVLSGESSVNSVKWGLWSVVCKV